MTLVSLLIHTFALDDIDRVDRAVRGMNRVSIMMTDGVRVTGRRAVVQNDERNGEIPKARLAVENYKILATSKWRLRPVWDGLNPILF